MRFSTRSKGSMPLIIAMAENEVLPPLHQAARQGDEAVVRELLDASPEAALVQIDGLLPLHYAACYGHEAATRLLVHAYPHTASVTDAAGDTPLHYATFRGKVAILNLLLDAHPHAAMVKTTNSGNLPLHFAATMGCEASVRQLLKVSPEAARVAADDGWLPLHCAAFKGNEAHTRLLLGAYPDAAMVATPAGHIPITLALRSEHSPTARAILLAAPATVTLRHLSEAGDTALELFADFLSMPGHLPLTPEDWELVPTPCPGIERCLPAALDTGFSQAAHVVRRLQPADASRLRCAALCLHRCHRIDKDMAATILAQCVV
jgi:ankyrin repeat protein